MATFNGEEWLDAQLQSIAKQTRLPEQLVISDDGSTDSTVKIAQEFAQTAPFDVALVEGPGTGDYGENFWSVAKHAAADIIAWCDQGDVWYPQKPLICERLMEDNKVQFLSHPPWLLTQPSCRRVVYSLATRRPAYSKRSLETRGGSRQGSRTRSS